MKPPRFKYHAPTTLDETLELLHQHGSDARVLAGGQSLMPLLNFRLARPAHLIDINAIAALSDIQSHDSRMSLGTLVRQRTLERSAHIAEWCPPLSQAMPYVGHAQIRNRGTLGGSLAHADPAAELPAVVVATDAQLILARKGSKRTVAAHEFFTGALTTVLQPDELLIGIEVPTWPRSTCSAVEEIAMRVGDFALAGVVTTLTLGPDGRVSRARIVCFGVDDRPVRQRQAERFLEGRLPDDRTLLEAGRIVSNQVNPTEDIHASAAYRKRMAGVLSQRALAKSASRARIGVA